MTRGKCISAGKCQIRGWRAVSAAVAQGRGSRRSDSDVCFLQTRVRERLGSFPVPLSRQPKTYPHPPKPAAGLSFVFSHFSAFSSSWESPEVGGGDKFWDSYYILLYYIILCDVILHHIILYYTMTCYSIVYSRIRSLYIH